MRRWMNVVEAAREALDGMAEAKRVCGYCKWMAWPEDVCTNARSARCADFVTAAERACERFEAARCCATCRHSLGADMCGVSLEQECRDGGFEAWEDRDVHG